MTIVRLIGNWQYVFGSLTVFGTLPYKDTQAKILIKKGSKKARIWAKNQAQL